LHASDIQTRIHVATRRRFYRRKTDSLVVRKCVYRSTSIISIHRTMKRKINMIGNENIFHERYTDLGRLIFRLAVNHNKSQRCNAFSLVTSASKQNRARRVAYAPRAFVSGLGKIVRKVIRARVTEAICITISVPAGVLNNKASRSRSFATRQCDPIAPRYDARGRRVAVPRCGSARAPHVFAKLVNDPP